jgi:hypothetical protein
MYSCEWRKICSHSIIDAYYNYILQLLHSIVVISLRKASSRHAVGKKIKEVTWGCYYFLFENKTVKHFVQCLTFVHSPLGRCPFVNYPVSTGNLCKSVFLAWLFGGICTYMQFLSLQICVYVYKFFTIQRSWSGKRNKKNLGQQWMPHAMGLAVLCHSFIHIPWMLKRLQNHMDIDIVNR